MKSDRKPIGITAIFVAIIMMLSVFALALSANVALAQDPVTLSGTVRDNQGLPFAGAEVEAIDTITQGIVGPVLTDTNGEYTMSIPPSTYDVQVVPPSGSGFQTAIAPGRSITSDTVLDFVLVPAGVAALSGKVLDPLGNGIPNQNVRLAPEGTSNWMTSTTDSSGNYFFEVAPGDYILYMYAYNPPTPSVNAPRYYELRSTSSLSLTESITMDITLPEKKVSMHMQDPLGNPVADVGITTNVPSNYDLTLGILPAWGYSYYSYTSPPATTDASGDATLWLFPTSPGNTYTFTATPPPETGFATTSLYDVSFTEDTLVTITLVEPVTLTGKVLDPLGNGIPNQNVRLAPEGTSNWMTSTTDSSGNYFFEVAPGDYVLLMDTYNPPTPSVNAPRYYELQSTSSLSLTESITMDITLPEKKVSVHVQDPLGNPVADVGIITNVPSNYDLTLGILPAWGYSYYSYTSPPATTDASGDATLWLFPTSDSSTYTFTATSPPESPFATFNVYDVAVTSDKTMIIVLQFVHAPPVTTASVTPPPNEHGIYADPVTVTLTATAASGFTVESTFYNLDDGPTQTYSEPFAVSDGGTHTIKYWSVDDAGVYETPKTLTIIISSNQLPTADAGGPYAANEGDTVTLDATDSWDPDNNIILYDWDLDNDGEYDDAIGVTTTVVFDDDGTITVGLRVTDDCDESDTATAEVEVTNVAPVADAGEDKAGDEPSTFTFTGSYTDPGTLDTQTYEWDFDYDGARFDADATGNGVTNTWDDDFDGTVALRVTDDDGGSGIDTCSVIVRNVAPTITSFTGPVDPAEVNSAVSLTGEFTDPGLDDTHTATFDWDDTTSTDCALINGEREVTGTHTYTEAGVYTVTLTVEDDDGGVDSETFQNVVVYDPDGGFVTGGGGINSPAAVYAADPALTGKANFGFVSKYKKGATTPTGNTEFQFKAGDLNFHSSDYDWLVIAGHKAMYKGTGTINGAGNYGFMISAIDEELTPSTGVDMFRIKIWDKDNGDAVVYDNQLGEDEDADPKTEIQGGSIVIHRGK